MSSLKKKDIVFTPLTLTKKRSESNLFAKQNKRKGGH